MRSAHLLGIEHGDQWPRGDRKPTHSGAIKHDGHDSMTNPVHETA
jgi:hypothetical protein